MPDLDAVVVLTTLATSQSAVTLVRALLERRLIACGTLVPGARSLYRWEDRVADESEVVVLLKTRKQRVAEIEQAFAELHPYTLPELLVIGVDRGLDRYLAWIAAETTDAASE